MSETTTRPRPYTVSVSDPDGTGLPSFSFTAADSGTRYVVTARPGDGRIDLDWSASPHDPGAERPRLEQEVMDRLTDRRAWVERITALVDQLQQWATALGWATKRIEKKLDDARVGRHRVPALLMQENTCRIILEPVGRSAPGADGMADLYLMPAYDDIASLYFYDGGWHIHYRFPGAVAEVNDRAARPLTLEAVERVLAEMRRHAE